MRSDESPLWSRLRELLRERGFDPNQVALATLFPDDTNMEFGILVTRDEHVYEFDLIYGKGDLNHQAASAFITDWRDRTEWWRDTPRRGDIELAVQLLANESA
jgi:hypothetical protein